MNQAEPRRVQEPLGVNGRNRRMTTALVKAAIVDEKKGHSFVPGQCKHTHSKEKRKEAYQTMSREKPFLEAYMDTLAVSKDKVPR
jgi:hypothetical protein